MAVYLFFNLAAAYFEMAKLAKKKEGLLPAFAIFAFFLLILCGLLYYFSYSEKGYRLLTWTLSLAVFYISKQITGLLTFFPVPNPADFLVLLILFIVTNGWWYYASMKQAYKKLTSLISQAQEGKDGIARLQAAKSPQDLSEKFHILINQLPNFEPVLSTEYRLRLEKLSIEHKSALAV